MLFKPVPFFYFRIRVDLISHERKRLIYKSNTIGYLKKIGRECLSLNYTSKHGKHARTTYICGVELGKMLIFYYGRR